MRGQWLGSYTGSADGKVMVNIDEVDDHFEGVAYLRPSTSDLPVSVAYLSTPNKDEDQAVTAYIYPIDPRTGFQSKWEDIKELYGEGVVYSSQANVNLKVRENRLHIDAVSDIGGTLAAVLDKPSGNVESKIQGQRMSWGDFKSHISSLSKFNYLFRGQQKPWSLCTSFHRRGRYRMSEFPPVSE